MIDLCLTLSTEHNVTEPAIQDVISKSNEMLQLCKNKFLSSLLSSGLSQDDQAKVATNFKDSFQDISSAFDTRFFRQK